MVLDVTMVLDVIEQIFTIVGASAGIIALIWQYKEYKQKAPNVSGYLHHANYEIIAQEKNSKITLIASFIIHNKGSSPTSLVDSIVIIRLQPGLEKILSYNAVQGKLNQTKIPSDIKANGTTKVEFDYSLEVDHTDYLDRCAVPINIRDPKQLDIHDLPLAVRFLIKHTYGQFELKGCIYRKDQPESQRIRGEQGALCFSQAEMAEENPQLILME